MSESIVFRMLTRKTINKGDIIHIEGKQCKITSINIVEPHPNVVGQVYVTGRCKQTESDKWSSLINNS